jgi:hypothetical protein
MIKRFIIDDGEMFWEGVTILSKKEFQKQNPGVKILSWYTE